MKSNLLLTLAALMLSMTIFSCDNVTKEKVSDGADDLIEGVAEPIDKISGVIAKSDIDMYNTIYGGENVYRFLAKDNEKGSVILPRFYTVNRADFRDLIDSHFVGQETFYASLAIVDKTYEFPSTASGQAHLADLIFHAKRPYTDGYLRDKGAGDYFFDNAKPCPTDCEAGTGANPGDEIDKATANTRINNFNKLYTSDIQYLTAHDSSSNKSVTIARYYAISRADFQGMLNASNSEYMYVSLAANNPDGNVYQTDLMIHGQNPGPQGSVSSDGDFFDFTMPCPEECDSSNSTL
jgi:hypothetical protein